MILERDQWHLGYASLLRDCRGASSNDGYGSRPLFDDGGVGPVGRALLLVHPDADAMATARILAYMLRADGVPHQLRPCTGWTRLRRILTGVGVVTPDEGDGDGREDDGVEGRGGGNRVEGASSDVRAVVLMNMGATRNLARLFRDDEAGLAGRPSVRCYVLDSRRPYHLSNVHCGKGVVLFNDRPFEEGEVPSDGDNLSGDESSSDSDSDDDSDEDGEDGGGRRGEESEGEQEFEMDDERGDEGAGAEEGDDNKDDERRRAKRQKTGDSVDPADDPAYDGDDPDRDADGGDDLRDSDDEAGGDFKKDNAPNPLDTTAATTDLTMNLDETLDTSQSQEGQPEEGREDQAAAQPGDAAVPISSLRSLRRARRARVRLHYSSGSWHASPPSWTAYALCRQLRFGDTPDLLWLACVGVTDAYLHGRLDVAGYGALTADLRRHVGRLFPDGAVDRAGRAVYAEDIEGGDGAAGGTLTQVGLSENGRILVSPSEHRLVLLRHTSLWDSLLHSPHVASRLRTWGAPGRRKLMEMLAKMGFPLDSCRQPWAFAGPGTRRRLHERLEDCAEEYGLGNVSYTGFIRVTGYKSLLSASDQAYAVTALLECSAAAIDGVSDKGSDGGELLTEEGREDREMVEAFNVAFDALNSNGGVAASAADAGLGGGEGDNLTNLVNGGAMTGTTGLGAGIRLAMTLQRAVMSAARGLVDRNAITRLSHFRYAYLHCGSGGGSGTANGRVVTPDNTGASNGRGSQFHVFAKPLVLTKLAHFLMDMHREDGRWTGAGSRPLVLLAEKPRAGTYVVGGYECPDAGDGGAVRNRFGQNFGLAARSMGGTFWFDGFDSNVVEVGAGDVQKFLEQLHYMLEQV